MKKVKLRWNNVFREAKLLQEKGMAGYRFFWSQLQYFFHYEKKIILGIDEPEGNAKNSVSVTLGFIIEFYILFHDKISKSSSNYKYRASLFPCKLSTKRLCMRKHLSRSLLLLLLFLSSSSTPPQLTLLNFLCVGTVMSFLYGWFHHWVLWTTLSWLAFCLLFLSFTIAYKMDLNKIQIWESLRECLCSF